MENSSSSAFVGPAIALLLVVLVAPMLSSSGMGGFFVPLVILALGVALRGYQVIPDPWRVKDADLSAWLESPLRSPDSGHTTR